MEKSKRLAVWEEVLNSITGGLGTLLGLAGFILLLIVSSKYQTIQITPGLAVFGGTLILSYLFSTLFHSFSFTKAKNVFQILDHASIFLLIAGTYTPFILNSSQSTAGYILLATIWLLAITGIIFRSIYRKSKKIIFVPAYLIMGWLAVITGWLFFSVFPQVIIRLLLMGGIFYTTGIIFYLWKRLPFSHTIWHLFVIAGSFCHFLAVLYLIKII